LISIIVPIYNVEKYLAKCISSIINQTYQNIEIVCVDDGSTDSSGELLDELAKVDSRVVVIHQKNSGLIGVRKNGVSLSKGELIAFVDSDDYIEPNMIQALLDNMRVYSSDIAVCSFDIVDTEGNILSDVAPNEACVGTEKAVKMLVFEDFAKTALYPMWNKLYKKTLFEKIRFPDGNFNLGEDQYLNLQLLNSAEKISFATEHCYNYVQREGSILKTMKLSYIESFFALMKLKKEMIERYQMLSSDREAVFENYFATIFDLYGFAFRSGNAECVEFFNKSLHDEEFFTFANLPKSPTMLARGLKFLIRRYL
jgi:glycosyltransferase involved in cell wall biosynthesis